MMQIAIGLTLVLIAGFFGWSAVETFPRAWSSKQGAALAALGILFLTAIWCITCAAWTMAKLASWSRN